MSSLYRMFISVALLTLCMGARGSVLAQATEEADPNPVVQQALNNFQTNQAYHFTLTTQTTTTLTPANGTKTRQFTSTSGEGDVAVNGDYHDALMIQTGQDQAEAEANPALNYERIRLGNALYVKFDVERSPDTAQYLGIGGGWQRYTELTATIDDPVKRQVLDNLVQVRLPSEFPANNAPIKAVTLGGNETVGGVETQIYDVELDALALLASQSPGSSDLQDLLQNIKLIASSDLSATYRLWIGTKDGRLYRSSLESHQSIPYLTAGGANGPDFDVESGTSIEVAITYPPVPVKITLPPGIR